MNHAEPRLPEAEGTGLELPDTPVNRLLSQTDIEPSPPTPSLFSSFTAPTAETSKPDVKPLGAAFFFFGVGVPASAILLELVSSVCANMAFDPLPTFWHVLLVCAVPLANLLVWRELRNDDAEYDWRLAAACGLAVGVSGFYALLFLPLVPVSLAALILLGLGILGLSPQMAFAFAIKGAIRLRRLKKLSSTPQPSFALTLGAGVFAPLAILIGLEAQTTLTRINLQRAASGNPATRLSGIRFLRSFGSQAVLLNACYWRAGVATDLIGSLFSLANPVDADKARRIFYRVTGEPFDSLPRPFNANNRLGPFRLLAFDDNIFDANRGGERVGGAIKGLSLAGSRIDGLLDADAALGYFEWTMVFKNDTSLQQEARAQIQLPPGGVVSRLTLWVNGEEREAAFASRGKVQAAYQSVVSARRDPVLVTSSGQDRVLVQCFPVPPNGEMKIRFGVTAPIALESKQRGWLKLPGIAERNFAVEKLSHAVWFESKRALQSSSKSLLAEHPENRLFAVRGQLSDGELSAAATLRVERDAARDDFWTPNPLSKSAEAIHQHLDEKDWPRPQRVVLVVDGSKAIQPHLNAIADALKGLPEGIELVAIAAGDEVADLSGLERGSPKFYGLVAEKIRRIEAAGGNDNLQALTRAWDLAAQSPGSVILWIHDAKPMLLENADDLRQRWERRPVNPLLFDLSATPGANRVAEKLDGLEAVQTVTRTADLTADLDLLFARWRGESKQVVVFREKAERRNQELRDDLRETSSHLARLWAFDETRRLLASNADDKFEQAVKLAASYQLVTPATGAVVLETKEQYERAGLQPVPQNSVPTIPEPEEWLLMIVAASVLLWVALRRRFRWQSV